MQPQSCDTMVALGNTTVSGQTIFAKNSDRPADECQPLILRARQDHAPGAMTACQFVTIPQVSTTYRHIGSRPYWCWGYEHGVNEHQVAIGNEALQAKLPEASTAKLVGMELLRLGLERSRTAAEAVEIMTALISSYGQGKFANTAGVRTYDNGYIVADPREAYVIETAGHEWAVKRVDGALGISNVYSVATDWERLSPGAETQAIDQGWWQADAGRFNFAEAYTASSRSEGSGAMRRARSCAVLNLRAGTIDARTMMAILGDHSDGVSPQEDWQRAVRSSIGICRHPEADGSGGCTAASLVAELCDNGERLPIYWCSLYSPCLSLFLPIFSEGALPSVLTVGDATPSDASPWWLFHRLNQLVLNGAPDAAAQVRSRWQPLQEELFTSAHRLAYMAKALIDDGRAAEASAQLTTYMAANAAQMVATVKALHQELAGEPVLA